MYLPCNKQVSQSRFNTRIRLGATVVKVEYVGGHTASAKVAGVKGKPLTLKFKDPAGGGGGNGRVATSASAAAGSASAGAIKRIMFKNLEETPEEIATKELINKASKLVYISLGFASRRRDSWLPAATRAWYSKMGPIDRLPPPFPPLQCKAVDNIDHGVHPLHVFRSC